MLNPWEYLPDDPPYILNSDRDHIAKFNLKAKDIFKFRLNILPEPYHGNPNADIVLLDLNPGYSADNEKFHIKGSAFYKASKENLTHVRSNHPVYLLDPEFSEAPGYKYWQQHLKELLSCFTREIISTNIFIVQLIGYHSTKFKPLKHIIPSQNYSFNLVREAIKRNAILVIMRKERLWKEYVPELKASRYFKLNSPISGVISRNNLSNNIEGWEMICNCLANKK